MDLSEILSKFSSIHPKDRIEFVKGLTYEELELCYLHSDRLLLYINNVLFKDEYNIRRAEKRNIKIEEILK